MAVYVPEEIIVQILHKLPIKSLVRFTCVSKTWLSLIKNHSFISDHLKLSISCSNKNPLLLLRLNFFAVNYSLHYDKEGYDCYMHLYFPFKTHKFYLRLVGTINGLICVANDYKTQTIIIWNPLIKKSINLPKRSITCYEYASYGFGFDSRSNDYKVLRLAKTDKDTLEAEIYSLNTNSWKRICATPRYKIKAGDRQFFVNGVMHVVAFRTLGNHRYRNLILGFDMSDEVFKEIELPQSLADDEDPYSLSLLVYKESIAVIDENLDLYPHVIGSHVWVMEEYGVVESWTKILSFSRQEEKWPRVLGFRKNGDLFLDILNEEIVLYDHESTEYKGLKVSGINPFVDYFVESLELLDNANAQSDPTVEND